MQWRQLAAALVLGGATLGGACLAGPRHAQAAPLAAGFSPGEFAPAGSDANVQQVYWVWRGGVRVWVGGPGYYGPRRYYGPPRYYGPRGPYWYGGRNYYHRRWYGGGWRYW